MIILQRIADEEFRYLLSEAPNEIESVAEVCRLRYRDATFAMEQPTGVLDKMRLRRKICDSVYPACLERGLLRGLAERLGFSWEMLLWSVIFWVVRQLVEEWF